ncbi:MAG: O-antigen ligase [Pseudomonadota bacterium]
MTSNMGSLLVSVLFLGVLSYFWVGLYPFPNPNAASLTTPYGGSSNRFNQIVVVLMSGILIFGILGKTNRNLFLRPRGLLIAMLLWFGFSALFASDPGTAYRRIIFALLVVSCSSAMLLLPKNREQFIDLMCIGMLVVVAVAYYGILALPHLAIHQFTDALEQDLAGDWRGHLGHKNAAAASMVSVVFLGLYLTRAKSLVLGAVIVVLATVFLWKSGSKTSFGLLPFTIVLTWMFERFRMFRPLIVLGALLVVNSILMSAATSSSVRELLVALGIDPTFTDRTSIWAIALHAIGQKPVTGYGFQAFWQTNELFRSGYSLYTWAVTAANAHNGYLDQLINGGIPGFLLVIVWLVFLPLKYASRALSGPNDRALTRLFLRIWLFSLFFACFESSFFGNTGPIWFTMLFGVFGLRLQALAYLIQSEVPQIGPVVLCPDPKNSR